MKLRCTGREFYAHGDILGLCEDEPETLYYGYDGSVWENQPLSEYDWSGRPAPFTPEERREIGDRMIALWRRWVEYAAQPPEEASKEQK